MLFDGKKRFKNELIDNWNTDTKYRTHTYISKASLGPNGTWVPGAECPVPDEPTGTLRISWNWQISLFGGTTIGMGTCFCKSPLKHENKDIVTSGELTPNAGPPRFRILLTGGKNNGRRIASSELYPASPSCTVPSLPEARELHATFLTADIEPRIVTCGGFTGEYKLGRPDYHKKGKDCFTLKDGRWQRGEVEDLRVPRTFPTVVTMSVGVYVLHGNMPVEAWGTSDFLPAGSSHWIKGPNVSISHRKGCSAQISTNSFLIVSNRHVLEFDTSVMEGPTSETGWQPEETWPQLLVGGGNQQAGCATIGSLFVVALGHNNGNSPNMEIINLKTKTLTKGEDMVRPRLYFHIKTLGTEIFALGGVYLTGGWTYLNMVEKWGEKTSTWQQAGKLELKRGRGFGAVVVPTEMVCPCTC